jgi:hypothetical protein
MPPGPEAEPRELLRWSRRGEIAGGILCALGAVMLWDVEWARWTLFGLALLAFSPWPGPSAVLRRGQHDPQVFESDPERRRARGRTAALVLGATLVICSAVAGYLLDGLGAALFMGGLACLGAALGAWPFLRPR